MTPLLQLVGLYLFFCVAWSRFWRRELRRTKWYWRPLAFLTTPFWIFFLVIVGD